MVNAPNLDGFASPSPPEHPPWNNRSPRLRVLVVEDNADSANTLAMVVQLDGHEVEVAYDGLKAVEAGRRFRPDVILLDIGLPGLDGWQVASTLLGETPTSEKKPLVVAISGRGAEDDYERSAEAGILLHVTKPANLDKLLGLLRRFRSVVN